MCNTPGRVRRGVVGFSWLPAGFDEVTVRGDPSGYLLCLLLLFLLVDNTPHHSLWLELQDAHTRRLHVQHVVWEHSSLETLLHTWHVLG